MRCSGVAGTDGFLYVVEEVPEALRASVERAYFRRDGERYVKWYPADMPQQALAAAQFARLSPTAFAAQGRRWREALTALCRVAQANGIALTLTGSAAAALQGAALSPGDLDILVDEADFPRMAALLEHTMVEPLMDYGDRLLLVRYFGRLCMQDTWVDLSAAPKPVFEIGEALPWQHEGYTLRVMSLEACLAAYEGLDKKTSAQAVRRALAFVNR